MGMKIIISSAVNLTEKDIIKEKLAEMQERKIIKYDDIYDCNEHGTFWDKESKQIKIDKKIRSYDWFICLIPNNTVGEATWGELQLVIQEKLMNSPIIISVFHPTEIPMGEFDEKIQENQFYFEDIYKEAQEMLGVEKGNYWVDYKYNDIADLLLQFEKEYKNAYKHDKAFWCQHIDSYARFGFEIRAKQLFFDEKRASCEWGFREGQDTYIYRNSVDGKIIQKLDGYGVSFLFVTGKPTSGKSRALYECLHDKLKNQKVVIMRDSNVIDICETLQVEKELIDSDNEITETFKKTNYYFICDQIYDVFQQADVPAPLRKKFLKIISEFDNCWLLASGTKASLISFVEDSEGIISPLGDLKLGGNSDLVTIPLISKDIDSQEILTWLRYKYNKMSGETMGDFIKELNDHKEQIIKEIFSSTDKYPYLSEFLKSIQLVLQYRHISPLLLPITILQILRKSDDAKMFKKETIACIKFLMNKSVIKITDSRNSRDEEIIKSLKNSFTDKRNSYFTVQIDDEEYTKIIPSIYTFTVNELVWEYLTECNLQSNETKILWDLYNVDDLCNAMEALYESYPHAATVRRLVSRVPKRQDFPDFEGDNERLRIAWKFAVDIVKSSIKDSNESEEELSKVYNILIGRANSFIEIEDLLKLMEERNVEVDDTTIGEMYNFLYRKLKFGHLKRDDNAFVDIVKKIQKLDEIQQKRDYNRGYAWTYKDFYRIGNQITLFSGEYDNYQKAYKIVFNAFRNLTYNTKDGHLLSGKDAVKYIALQKDSIEERNLNSLMSILAKLCKTKEDVKSILKCHNYYGIEPSTYVLHRIGIILKDYNKLKDVIDYLFPKIKDKLVKSVYYERVIVCFVIHAPSFSESVKFYNMWHDDLNLKEKHNTRLVSLCLLNCRQEEFQSAIAYVNSLPQNAINTITYNLLISFAQNTEDVLYLVNRMQPQDIDEYTLSNALKCVETIAQKNYGREIPKVSNLQTFISAYELINHPKLKSVRTRTTCLQKMYRLASDIYQENYIDRIAGKERLVSLMYNDFINSTRIMRPYRSFTAAYYDIYLPAFSKFDETQGKYRADLFNSICAKYYKEIVCKSKSLTPEMEKIIETIKRQIESVIEKEQIILDEFFFLNYYIKFLGKHLFNENGDTMSLLFTEWFYGHQGNYNSYNIEILPRYVDYIISQPKISYKIKWKQCKTIYIFYKLYFKEKNIVFKPHSNLYASLLKILLYVENNKEELDFIDHEMTSLEIERSIKLNFHLEKYKKLYNFKYLDNNPIPANRQKDNLWRIRNAQTCQEVILVLCQEVKMEGFVAPSIINSVLNKFRNFQRNHSYVLNDFIQFIEKNYYQRTPIYNSLSSLANKYIKHSKLDDDTKQLLKLFGHLDTSNLTRKEIEQKLKNICLRLDIDQYEKLKPYIKDTKSIACLTYMALLTKDDNERMNILKLIESSCDYTSEITFSYLAHERVIAKTSIETSQKYFFKWISIYKDIYDDNIAVITDDKVFSPLSIQCRGRGGDIPDDNVPKQWKTIGIHLKNEVLYISSIMFKYHLSNINDLYNNLIQHNDLKTIDILAEILKFYKEKPQYFLSNNFSKTFSLNDAINLIICYKGDINYWNEVLRMLSYPYKT